jgi:hypothetical protein
MVLFWLFENPCKKGMFRLYFTQIANDYLYVQ